MRGYVLHQPAADPGAALVLTEKKPNELGVGEVLVRMRAASLNYRDLLIATGRYGGKLPPQLVPLSDGAGEILSVGPRVDRFAPGDRVATCFFQQWVDGPLTPTGVASALGGAVEGVLAEHVVLHQDGLVRLPDYLSFEEGAALPCAAVTAWHALNEAGHPIKPGETVLVLGTGGVSIFALQFATAAGARVIVTSSSDEKLQRVKAEFGAEFGINYRSTPDWEEEVLRLTDGRGVDRVVEVGGAGTVPRSLAATVIGGRISLIGVLSGTLGGGVDLMPLVTRVQHIDGIYVGSRAMFERMLQEMSAARMRPVIDRAFPFEATPDAYRYLQSGEHFGKVLITFDDASR